MRGSIFFKLLGILIITGALVNFMVYLSIRYFASTVPFKKDMIESFSGENLKRYIAEIGQPPNIEVMKKIAAQLECEIRIEKGEQTWMTKDDLPSIETIERRQRREGEDHPGGGFHFGHHSPPPGDQALEIDRGPPPGDEDNNDEEPSFHRAPPKRIPFYLDIFRKEPPAPAITMKSGDHRYAFFLPDRRPFAGKYMRFLFPFMLLLTFLIASAFFAIRFILMPLKTLMKGVEEVANGNLEHRVTVAGGDEFSLLGASFNNMVSRIKETMEAKERLLIDISHELQSPLTRMKLAIELMREDKAKDRLKTNLKDIETMVAEILESARLDSSTGSLQIQKIDARQLIREFLYHYETLNAPVFYGSEETALIAEMDPSRIIIVIRNLIENALKYADNNQKRVDVRVFEEQGNLRVEVQDNGSGIPEEEIPKIFEPFYRIDKSRARATGGYGLGLSLCKRIVDAHQGAIGIVSGERGTTVWFTIPKKAAAA